MTKEVIAVDTSMEENDIIRKDKAILSTRVWTKPTRYENDLKSRP